MPALALPTWLTNLLDPDNPFVPWLLIIDLVLLLVHFYIVYWVYRDAAWRYNRGAPWGLLAAVVPVGGWLFYLAYRSSPLVQFDRIDAELFDEAEHTWTDYDTYKANRGQGFFKELWAERDSYSPWVRLSRLREQGRRLSPEERRDVRQLRAQRRAEARAVKTARLAERRALKLARKQAARERQTVVGLHGQQQRMSDRRQRSIRRKLAVVEQLRLLPREDAVLEELIYEMRYNEAEAHARDALAVAEELGDQQGILTFNTYLERLERATAAGPE